MPRMSSGRSTDEGRCARHVLKREKRASAKSDCPVSGLIGQVSKLVPSVGESGRIRGGWPPDDQAVGNPETTGRQTIRPARPRALRRCSGGKGRVPDARNHKRPPPWVRDLEEGETRTRTPAPDVITTSCCGARRAVNWPGPHRDRLFVVAARNGRRGSSWPARLRVSSLPLGRPSRSLPCIPSLPRPPTLSRRMISPRVRKGRRSPCRVRPGREPRRRPTAGRPIPTALRPRPRWRAVRSD
jgi:hypothetical protein